MGPLEFLAVNFEGNRFTGEIMPELQALRDRGTIRVLDFLLVTKDNAGTVRFVELDDLQIDRSAFMSGELDDGQWFSEEDILKMADAMSNESSVAMMLFEHTWAAEFSGAIRRAGGELLVSDRIPASEVERVMAEMQAETTTSEKVA